MLIAWISPIQCLNLALDVFLYLAIPKNGFRVTGCPFWKGIGAVSGCRAVFFGASVSLASQAISRAVQFHRNDAEEEDSRF